MSKTRLPAAIQEFVEGQSTTPVEDIWKVNKEELTSPYGSYYYRAIACMMLSGRVSPKSFSHGAPNMTDVNRIGKEANFNQFLFERVARFLVAADVITDPTEGVYGEGPNLDAFWKHKADRLPKMTRRAILFLVDDHPGYQVRLFKEADNAHLIGLLTLFFTCFRDRAVRESQFADVLQGFARLPKDDLAHLTKGKGLAATAVDPYGWSGWLEREKHRKALIEALYLAEWLYYTEVAKTGWVFASPVGLGMLGLASPPKLPQLPDTFKATSSLGVDAGVGLPHEKLVPLFRYCRIEKIAEVCEFRLDRKKMDLAPAGTSPGGALREVLKELKPLPSTITSLLGTQSKIGGEIALGYCSAIVKPENADVLAAIRAHPNLKGYLDAHAPPGYLIIKPRSDPNNFILRCRKLGFTVKSL